MTLAEAAERSLQLRRRFAELESRRSGRPWGPSEVAQGLVGDVGDLMKLVMAREGWRPGPPNLDERLRHELADCLWGILVLARQYGYEVDQIAEENFTALERYLEAQAHKG